MCLATTSARAISTVVSTVTPRYPDTVLDMPNFATDSAALGELPDAPFKDTIARTAYEEAGIGPEDVDPGALLGDEEPPPLVRDDMIQCVRTRYPVSWMASVLARDQVTEAMVIVSSVACCWGDMLFQVSLLISSSR